MARTLEAIRYLESCVTGAEHLEGLVLRYGFFYGPGTSLGKGGAHVELRLASRWSHISFMTEARGASNARRRSGSSPGSRPTRVGGRGSTRASPSGHAAQAERAWARVIVTPTRPLLIGVQVLSGVVLNNTCHYRNNSHRT